MPSVYLSHLQPGVLWILQTTTPISSSKHSLMGFVVRNIQRVPGCGRLVCTHFYFVPMPLPDKLVRQVSEPVQLPSPKNVCQMQKVSFEREKGANLALTHSPVQWGGGSLPSWSPLSCPPGLFSLPSMQSSNKQVYPRACAECTPILHH